MGSSGSDKKRLRTIFEESLKEISSEGKDEFRRSVSEILEDKKPKKEEKKDESSDEAPEKSDLNEAKLQD